MSQLLLLGSPKKLGDLQIKTHGATPAQVRSERDGLLALTYSAERVAAYVDEPFAAPPVEYMPHVTISQGYRARLFVRRAMRAAASTEAANQDVQDFAYRLAAASHSTAHGLLPYLINAVAKQVPNDGPESKPVKILHSHTGRAIYLLRAVLRALGQPVRLIALRTKSDSSVDDWPDQTYQSTALLVRRFGLWVPVYFFRRSAMLGHLPANWRGGDWRSIDPAWPDKALAQSAQAIPEAWISTLPHLVKVDASLDAQGQMQARLNMQIRAPLAGFMRSFMKRMDPRDVKRIFEAWLGGVFAGARLQQMNIQGQDDILQAMTVSLTFSSDAYAKTRADALVVDRLLPSLSLVFGKDQAALGSFVRLAKRKTPMYLNAYDEQSLFRLQLPKAFKMLNAPPSLTVDGVFGHYHQQVRSSAAKLEIERDVHRSRRLVLPDDYVRMRRAAQRIEKALGGQLVLVPDKALKK